MSSSNGTLLYISVGLLFFSSYAEKTEKGFFFSQSIGASYNPIGIILDSKLFFRLPLVDKSGVLWESTKTEAGVQNEWTPADNVLSLRLFVEPIAVCDIVFKAGFYGIYNEIGYGCFRFNSSDDDYCPDAQKSLVPTNSRGYWLSVAPTFKVRFGNMVALNSTTINRVTIDGSGYFLEVRSYLLHRTVDFDVMNDSYLLLECAKALIAGVTYRFSYVAGTSSHSKRLNIITIIRPQSKPLKGAFAAINAGAYLDDPAFGGKAYIGCLIGKEFRFGNGPKGKDVEK
jgi:hypothetical protein